MDSSRGSGLFNLKTDVGEKQDLSATHPGKLAELKQHFARWKKQMDAAEPAARFEIFSHHLRAITPITLAEAALVKRHAALKFHVTLGPN